MIEKKIMWNGKLHNAVSLEFAAVEGHSAHYRLEDGQVLSIRIVIKEILRLKELDPQGKNIYIVDSDVGVKVISKEEVPAKGVH